MRHGFCRRDAAMAGAVLPDGGGRHADLGPDIAEAAARRMGLHLLLGDLLRVYVRGDRDCVAGHSGASPAYAARTARVAGPDDGGSRGGARPAGERTRVSFLKVAPFVRAPNSCLRNQRLRVHPMRPQRAHENALPREVYRSGVRGAGVAEKNSCRVAVGRCFCGLAAMAVPRDESSTPAGRGDGGFER
jgi:hypothetical protein